MNIKRGLALTVILFVILLGVTACSFGTKKIGWVGNSYPGSFNASFISFTGIEVSTVIKLSTGDLLTIDYESDIKEGSFTIAITDPDGEKVADINTNEKGIKELTAQKSGGYKIVLEADKAKGSFSFSW